MNLFALTNFGTTLCPEALCPLAEPLPPDSAGVARAGSIGLTTEPTVRLLEEEGGLRKKKSHQEKATTQKGTKPCSPITTPSRSGTPLPSPHRFDGRLIRRPFLDVRRHPTSRRACKQDSTTIKQGSKGNFKSEYKTKEVRCTLESVCAKGTSSGSGGLL